jgi:hypothetical protein
MSFISGMRRGSCLCGEGRRGADVAVAGVDPTPDGSTTYPADQLTAGTSYVFQMTSDRSDQVTGLQVFAREFDKSDCTDY